MSIKDITLGTYVFGESFLHQLDPRIKLGCLLVFVAGIGIGRSWRAFVLAGAFLCFACIRSGIGPGYLSRSLIPFRWLILVTFLLNVLFTGGHILIDGPLPYGGITAEGLSSGAVYSLRLLYLVAAASLLTLTTQPVVLVAGVEKLLEPFSRFGVKSHDIALAMVITIRFIPVLIDEAVKIRKSHIARGFRPEKNIVSRIRGCRYSWCRS
jgi:energy-coupling factor transport system permease protein